jgi:hypothetical protein
MPIDRALRERFADAVHAVTTAPTTQELQEAPLLDGWIAAMAYTGHLLLLGTVEGHPTAGSGTISTSPLVKIDTDAGYARTLSRWYRLGRPMQDTDPATVQFLLSPECTRWCPVPEDELGEMLDRVVSGINGVLRRSPYDA